MSVLCVVHFARHRWVKAAVYVAVLCAMVLGLSLAPVGAGTAQAQTVMDCYYGVSYHDAGTSHNYVKFQVKTGIAYAKWHTRHTYLALMFPADLWAYPDGNGVAKAGIRYTDNNPPYSPSNYRLCGYRVY